ncbi:MAG: AAA family ATPase [Gallionella sp.]|nr:AAA family ATPase [Gallionella sp.]
MAMQPHTPTTNHENLPPLILALFDPACYGHAITQIQLIETHISWVLLTGEYAYKIKKPVNLGFLDFGTLALRRQACADEVRLNRRLAPELYLGVVAITGNTNAPHVDSQSANPSTEEAIEYAVKMRQFSPDDTLDHLDERGELGTVQIDLLAARLARFHFGECHSAPPDSPWGEPDAIAQPVKDNFRLLAERLSAPAEIKLLEKLRDWSLAEHERLAPLMRERKRAGRIRECHGDLHLGNLAWVNGELLIFDCIEFSPALRWIDVISEVAFCFMDLLQTHPPPNLPLERGGAIVPSPSGGRLGGGWFEERAGRHRDLAMRFLNAWLEASGDYAGVALLRYYAVYRAMVRAKVAALRAVQGNDAEVSAYLQLAEQLAQDSHAQNRRAQLWITHGLSGSGKTTLTQSLLEKRGMIRLRSDVERKRLAGLDVLARSGGAINEGLYTRETSRRTYAYLAQLAGGLLDAGWQIIIDAAFLERWQRDLLREIAQRRNVPFRILDIRVDHATLRERVDLRNAQGKDASEADLRVLQHQIETAQSLGEDELPEVTTVSGMDALAGLQG